ncbi:cytochrome P450 [Mycena belliarum]|uniref:Cytochrome P450 n=1 Tax=Mycena belliarum TaxID=1033014 RepID=A0AAD6UEX8_9AGAR|nr:cytochrome P450 [Mycena belliae]
MSFETPTLIWAIALGALGVLLYVSRARKVRSKLPLPPGPKKLPLLGNILDISANHAWKQYTEWSKEYNTDILHLDLAGSSLIVLSSLKATEDLLEKRSSMYSDRQEPRFPMMSELMGWDFNIAFMKYGTPIVVWLPLRMHRRLFNQGFTAKASQKYLPKQLVATHGLIRQLLHTPDAFMDHFRHWAAEIIMSITYGIEIQPKEDPYVLLAHKAISTMSDAGIPGKHIVDSFPVLKRMPAWLPGTSFKRQAQGWYKLARAMADAPFSETKRQISSGIASSSFIADGLQTLKNAEAIYYTESALKATAATMFIGGADTSVTALEIFVLAMLSNPEAQRRAQAEIDAVTGARYIPDFADEASMPYVAAVVKEVLRWRNVLPIAVPHYTAFEDNYRGYRIPAGSMVIGNTWAILHDEVSYPDPYAFEPERFLLDGKINPAVQSPDIAFGYGRRLCPGRHAAVAGVWIAVVSILATLDIMKLRDERGEEIEPTYEFGPGLISQPLPFKCAIKPRSSATAALIRATADQA